MNETTLNCIRAALLFMAEKYRLIIALADRFDDGAIIDIATVAERNARRVATTVGNDGITVADDATLVETALSAYTDALNRQMQSLYNKGLVTDAGVVESNIRAVYAAAQEVGVIARGLALQSTAAPAVTA